MSFWKRISDVFKEALSSWLKDKAPRLSAALAFYAIFSLAPLLIIVIAIGGLMFGQSTVRIGVLSQIQGLIGPEGAKAIGMLLEGARHAGSGFFPTLVGVITLLIGATGALIELQDGLGRVWKIPEQQNFLRNIIFQRLSSLAMVLCIAFLLLVSLVVSALITIASMSIHHFFLLGASMWHLLDIILSWSMVTALFAVIYKVLPQTNIQWADVWGGAAVASFLFTVGKFLVGFYIGTSAISSTFGAAGSFVVMLVWVYYSSLLLYFGAEFTQIYALRLGSRKT